MTSELQLSSHFDPQDNKVLGDSASCDNGVSPRGSALARRQWHTENAACATLPMDYLLKPSLPFVAGLTLGVAIAKATAVAKIRIKQFLAIPLAGKVVAGP